MSGGGNPCQVSRSPEVEKDRLSVNGTLNFWE